MYSKDVADAAVEFYESRIEKLDGKIERGERNMEVVQKALSKAYEEREERVRELAEVRKLVALRDGLRDAVEAGKRDGEDGLLTVFDELNEVEKRLSKASIGRKVW